MSAAREGASPRPHPGSREALEAGCSCPVLDNGHGRGYLGGMRDEEGKVLFVVIEGCPLHDVRGEQGG